MLSRCYEGERASRYPLGSSTNAHRDNLDQLQLRTEWPTSTSKRSHEAAAVPSQNQPTPSTPSAETMAPTATVRASPLPLRVPSGPSGPEIILWHFATTPSANSALQHCLTHTCRASDSGKFTRSLPAREPRSAWHSQTRVSSGVAEWRVGRARRIALSRRPPARPHASDLLHPNSPSGGGSDRRPGGKGGLQHRSALGSEGMA